MDRIRVAALSPQFVPGDVGHNLEAARRGIEACADRGVELALFSEWYLTNCVDEQSYRVAQPVPDGPAVAEVVRLAQRHGLTVAMGIEELDPLTGVVYNTHFLAGPEGYIGKHRKTHLMASEWGVHRAGDRFDVFTLRKCHVGMSICHENMYPETSRVLALRGAEVLLSPFGCGGEVQAVPQAQWLNDFHMACWRARCFDNGVFMVVSGGNGGPSRRYPTYACVIDPWGQVLSPIAPEPDPTGLNLIMADLDPERLVSRRTNRDYPLRKRRPELYGPLTQAY